MKIIIAGIGSAGLQIIEGLQNLNHNIIVIDGSPSKIENLVSEYNVKGVAGNCASKEILKEAGISSADLLIAATSNDELNILTCIIGKKLGVKCTIARSSKMEYAKIFDDELGINLTVNPQYEAALQIVRMLRFPSAISVQQFSDKDVELVELLIPDDSPLVGIQLKNINDEFGFKVLICAAKRGGNPIIPTGNFVIEPGDIIYLTSTKKDTTSFFKKLKWNKPAKNCMILGGSTTSEYLIKELAKSNIELKLIEKNKKRAQKLAQLYNNVEVVLGDGTDQELLIDEGIADFDAFVSLTELDEQNIITSMFAKSMGVEKVVTKITQLSYQRMLQNDGLYSTISTKTSSVEQVIRFVRLLQNKKGSGIHRLFHIMNGQAEILEFLAEDNFKQFNIQIKDLPIRNGVLIAGILRDDDFIIPGGSDIIKPKDHVIIVTLHEGFNNLNDILD